MEEMIRKACEIINKVEIQLQYPNSPETLACNLAHMTIRFAREHNPILLDKILSEYK